MPPANGAFAHRRQYLPLALPLFVYLLLPTCNYYWDGVAFSINIERHLPPGSIFQPSHLLYTLAGSGLYHLAEALGIRTRALLVLQFANSVLAGLSVILFCWVLRLRGVAAAMAVPAALAFGFSATWWRFSTDANSYVPSIFFLISAFVLLEGRRTSVLAGLALAGAMVFHELGIFFLPFALARLWRRPGSLAAFASGALLPVAAVYAAGYSAWPGPRTPSGILAWASTHSPDSGFSFHPLADAGYSLRGTLRLCFGGRIGDFVAGSASYAAIILLAVAAIALVGWIWHACIRPGRAARPGWDLLLWLGAYVAFLFFWMPQNTFYRLFYLPPLVAILATSLEPLKGARVGLWLCAGMLFLWNFVFMIDPQSRPESNAPLRFALAERGTWPPGTEIVYQRFDPDLWTISYFSPQARWLGIEEGDLGGVENDLQDARARGNGMWLEASAYDSIARTAAGRSWLAAHDRPDELLRYRDARHDFQFHRVR